MNDYGFSLQLLESSCAFSPRSCSILDHFVYVPGEPNTAQGKTNHSVTEVVKTGLSQTIYTP